MSLGSIMGEDLGGRACQPAIPFGARITHARGWNRLSLVGELDLVSAPILQAAFDRVESAPVGMIVVDLRQLSFMDAAGLHVLAEAHKRARRGRWSLVVVRGPRPVQRLLELTGFDKLLGPVDDPGPARPERLLCTS